MTSTFAQDRFPLGRTAARYPGCHAHCPSRTSALRRRLGVLLLTAASICASRVPALAQAAAVARHRAADRAKAAPPLRQVVITATKLHITQRSMTQAADVVTHVQIEAQAQTSVVNVLRELPGIQFEVAGPPGQSMFTRLRGFSDSTLYVFDGITMNTGGSGDVGYLLGQLDPSMVRSIQVLRGPRATTYGANTTSGVIDFTTLGADRPEASVSLQGGSLDWMKARIGLGDRVRLGEGVLSASLNGSFLRSNGMNEFEFAKNGTVVGRTTYDTRGLELGGSFYLTDNQFQSADLIESIPGAPPPYFAVQIPDPSNLDTTKAGIVSLWFRQQLTSRLSQKLTVGWAGQDLGVVDRPLPNGGLLGSYVAPYDGWTDPNTYLPYAAGQTVLVYQTPYTYKTVNNNREADYNIRYRTGAISALLGATYLGQAYDQSEDYAGSLSGGHESQSVRSVYGDASLGWFDNRLHTALGARFDSYTEWKSKVTYSVGATYRIVPALALYANYGTSFTQPTLDQLYDPIYGNRSITPENASTIEAGLRGHQLGGALTESLTYWHSYVDNVIAFDYSIYNPRIVNGYPYGQYANTEAERSQGVELEMACRMGSHWRLTGNYTHTDAHLESGGVWGLMILNARNMGNLGLTYTEPKFDVGANLFATGPRLRWAGDYWAPGYARLDLFGRYHATRRLDLYGRVQNALDRRITEVLGYRSPGIYFVAGAKYQFN